MMVGSEIVLIALEPCTERAIVSLFVRSQSVRQPHLFIIIKEARKDRAPDGGRASEERR